MNTFQEKFSKFVASIIFTHDFIKCIKILATVGIKLLSDLPHYELNNIFRFPLNLRLVVKLCALEANEIQSPEEQVNSYCKLICRPAGGEYATVMLNL